MEEGEFLRGGKFGDETRRMSWQKLGQLAWAKLQNHRTCGMPGEAGKEAGEIDFNLTVQGLTYLDFGSQALSCGDNFRKSLWGAI